MEERSYAQDIEEADRIYRERTENINKPKRKRRKRKKRICFWPGCENKVQTSGLCAKHRGRYYAGTLLMLDHTAFPRDEMFDLHKDVIAFSAKQNISIGVAVVWLLSKGLDGYEDINK